MQPEDTGGTSRYAPVGAEQGPYDSESGSWANVHTMQVLFRGRRGISSTGVV